MFFRGKTCHKRLDSRYTRRRFALTDTHAALWYLYEDERLSLTAREFIRRSLESGEQIAVSTITMVEVIYLVEKQRIPEFSMQDLLVLFAQEPAAFIQIPLDHYVTTFVPKVSRTEVPDMPDRIVAATALSLGVPVISRDRRIRATSIETIW